MMPRPSELSIPHSAKIATSIEQPNPSSQTTPTREASPTDQSVDAQASAAANIPALTRSDPPVAEVPPAPARPANNSYGSQSVIGDAGSPATGPMAAANTFSDGTVIDPTSFHRQHRYHRHRFLFGFRF
jgi:hypothetical protein